MTDDAARHISREGLAALEAELRELETEGRRAIAERIRTERSGATSTSWRSCAGVVWSTPGRRGPRQRTYLTRKRRRWRLDRGADLIGRSGL
jgi:hypothetical protein